MLEWKDVVGFEEYFMVSKDGKVFSKRSNKILKQHKNKSGYMVVSTRIGGRNGKSYCFKVHRIVAAAFLPSPANHILEFASNSHYGVPHVNHIDGNKANNSIENLEWCTKAENECHAVSLGLRIIDRGHNSHFSKLSNDDVAEIREEYLKGSRDFGSIALGKKFNVHQSTITRIVNNLTWTS